MNALTLTPNVHIVGRSAHRGANARRSVAVRAEGVDSLEVGFLHPS